jgi:type III secretion system (T3SS) SseB-like protein
MTFPNPSPKEPREIHVTNVQFLREQDGKPEQLLKSRLIESFNRHGDVRRAYLAQVSSGRQPNVALCLKTAHGPDQNLVREIGAIFAAIFVRQEHLDILFLSDTQESALTSVCAPFFAASVPGH